MTLYLLVDNGSKQPEATLRLRELAAALSQKSGKTIHPVSLQHADAIPADKLNGQAAQTFTPFINAQLQQGRRDFIVLPLFFGESRALSAFIPQQVEALAQQHGEFDLTVAGVTYPLSSGEPRLAQIIVDHIQAAQQTHPNATPVLVDHGSPVQKITQVREAITKQAEAILGQPIAHACMERREGAEYDFNGQLLADWLEEQAQQGITDVIIAMQFFLPGRHAGACGDVEAICEGVVKQHPQLRYTITPLISEHPLLLEILRDRMQAVE